MSSFRKTSDIIEGAIYVIRKNGELFIKRVSKSPFILLSDNSQSASAYKRWRHD